MTREIDSFRRFLFSAIDRLIDGLDGLEAAELNWHPAAPDTNSLAVLGIHVLGTVEENLLGVLCGRATERQREAEFAARGSSSEAIRQLWNDLRARLDRELELLAPSELDRERGHPRRGILTGREVLIAVTQHVGEHLGQAELTRQLLRATTS